MTKKCLNCKKIFKGKTDLARFCSNKCYKKWHYKNNMRSYKTRASKSYHSDPKKAKEYRKEYAQKNPKIMKKAQTNFRKNNPMRAKEIKSNWNKKNKDYFRKRYHKTKNIPKYKEYRYNYKRKNKKLNCTICNKEIIRRAGNMHKNHFCSYYCLRKFIISKAENRIETDIELIMKKLLLKNKISFEQFKQIGNYNIDFLINKICIECDGLYWHNLDENKIRDKRKDTYLKNKGYVVLRFNDKEIKNNIQKVERCILHKLGLKDSSKICSGGACK